MFWTPPKIDRLLPWNIRLLPEIWINSLYIFFSLYLTDLFDWYIQDSIEIYVFGIQSKFDTLKILKSVWPNTVFAFETLVFKNFLLRWQSCLPFPHFAHPSFRPSLVSPSTHSFLNFFLCWQHFSFPLLLVIQVPHFFSSSQLSGTFLISEIEWRKFGQVEILSFVKIS